MSSSTYRASSRIARRTSSCSSASERFTTFLLEKRLSASNPRRCSRTTMVNPVSNAIATPRPPRLSTRSIHSLVQLPDIRTTTPHPPLPPSLAKFPRLPRSRSAQQLDLRRESCPSGAKVRDTRASLRRARTQANQAFHRPSRRTIFSSISG